MEHRKWKNILLHQCGSSQGRSKNIKGYGWGWKRKGKARAQIKAIWGNKYKSEIESGQEREHATVNWSVSYSRRNTHCRQIHRQPIEGIQSTLSTLAVTASILAGTIHSYVFRFFSLLKMIVSVLCFLKNSSFVTISGKRCGWGQNQDYNSSTPGKLSIVLHIGCKDGSEKEDEQWIVLTAASFLPLNSIKT